MTKEHILKKVIEIYNNKTRPLGRYADYKNLRTNFAKVFLEKN